MQYTKISYQQNARSLLARSRVKVVIESSSRSVLNLFNLGANKKNVTQLEEYISNEVYKLCSDEEINLRPSEIKLRPSEIKIREK